MSERPSHELEVNAVLAEYLAAVEAGEPVDRQTWLQRYPHLAEELQAFFDDESHLDKLATILPPNPASDESNTPTLGPTESSADSTLGTVRYFGDYELLEEIGRGGMGVVYKAKQVSLKRVVALKMILAGSHAGEQDIARFRTEAEAVAKLQHPHIVQIHEIGEHEGHPYTALEFVEGGSLDAKLNGTPMSAKDAARLVEVMAHAVESAHREGIIHRDLKPANVLLTDVGTPKITDFGLAKLVAEESGQTQSGAILGTPSYMAPEQAEGKAKAVGPPADIYALGAILYECLTGRPPFRAETPSRHHPPSRCRRGGLPASTPAEGADRSGDDLLEVSA